MAKGVTAPSQPIPENAGNKDFEAADGPPVAVPPICRRSNFEIVISFLQSYQGIITSLIYLFYFNVIAPRQRKPENKRWQ